MEFQEVLKENFANCKTTEEIIKFWENLGFLQGLNNELKEKCALQFHKCTSFLTKDYTKDRN